MVRHIIVIAAIVVAMHALIAIITFSCIVPDTPKAFNVGNLVRIKITGATGQIIKVSCWGNLRDDWKYHTRVAVQLTKHPRYDGIVSYSNPTETTVGYAIVAFRDYELDPLPLEAEAK